MTFSKGRRPKAPLEAIKVAPLREVRLWRTGTTFFVELWNLKAREAEERLFDTHDEAEARAYLRGVVTGSMLAR